MKKAKNREKHPMYRLVMAGFIGLLLLGIMMFVLGILWGDKVFIPPMGQSF